MTLDPMPLLRASCSRSLLFVALAALACGPDGGADSGAGDSSAEGDASADGPTTASDASESAEASASGTGSASGGSSSASTGGTSDDGSGDSGSNDDGSCPPNSVQVEPGCAPAPEGVAIPEAGCYEPCETLGAECGGGGVCRTAWVNPCVCPEGEDCCAACGGESTLCLPGGATGAECMTDEHCASGVCWDFSDYDKCCFGTACSGPCRSDDDCVALATDAGAKTPESATCSPDGRCSLVGTGLGSWACAGPPCG